MIPGQRVGVHLQSVLNQLDGLDGFKSSGAFGIALLAGNNIGGMLNALLKRFEFFLKLVLFPQQVRSQRGQIVNDLPPLGVVCDKSRQIRIVVTQHCHCLG
jgi:hypothetical protein